MIKLFLGAISVIFLLAYLFLSKKRCSICIWFLSLSLIFSSTLLIFYIQETKTNKTTAESEFVDKKVLSNIDFEKEFQNEESLKYAKEFIGKKAPNLNLTNMNGEKVTLNSLKGKKILLEIAQTNCESCIEIHSILDDFKKNNPNIVLLKIYPIDTKDTIEKYWIENEILPDYSVVAGNGRTPVYDLYKIKYTPTVHLINEDGVIAYSIIGTFSKEMLDRFSSIAFD